MIAGQREETTNRLNNGMSTRYLYSCEKLIGKLGEMRPTRYIPSDSSPL
jgi:hypothetical protein